MKRGRFGIKQRFISAVIVCVFVLSNSVFAVSEQEAQSAVRSPQLGNELPTANDELRLISADQGSVEERYIGKSDKTIYYIQDAHDSLEAQENIAHIIKSLVKEKGIKTVFEEGFEGPVPTDELFGFMTDKEGKEAVSYFLLDHLRLGGAEYAHINRKEDFKLIGIDSFKDYLENVNYYQKTSQIQKETDRDLNLLTKHVTKLSDRYFPKEIKEWMKLRERFDKKQLSLGDYLFRLIKLRAESGERRAGKNNGKSGSQPSALSPQLDIIAKYIHNPQLTQEESKELEAKLKAVDAKTLFKEIEELETSLADRYLTAERDKTIFRYLKTLNLLIRLNHLELTPEEYDVVKQSLQTFNTNELADFLVQENRKTIVLSKRWEDNIQQSIQFYELARKRDDAISAHLDNFLKDKNEKEAILVFGGFHKTGIKDILKTKGISYAIISPRITKEDPKHHAYYQRLMSQGYYPYEVGKGPYAARSLGLNALTRIVGLEPVRDYTERLHSAYQAAKLNNPELRATSLGSTFKRVFSPVLATALLAVGGSFVMPAIQAEEVMPIPTASTDTMTSEKKIEILMKLMNQEKVTFDELKPYLADTEPEVVRNAIAIIAVKNIPVTNEFIKSNLNHKSERVVTATLMLTLSRKTTLELSDFDNAFKICPPGMVLLAIENQPNQIVNYEILKQYFENADQNIVRHSLNTARGQKVVLPDDVLKRLLGSSNPMIANGALRAIMPGQATFESLKPHLEQVQTRSEALDAILRNRILVGSWNAVHSYAEGEGNLLLVVKIARDQKIRIPITESKDFLRENQDAVTEEIFGAFADQKVADTGGLIKPYFDYMNSKVAVAALKIAENPDVPLKIDELKGGLEHKDPAVVKAGINVIRARNLHVTFDLLKSSLNSHDQSVRDDVRKLLDERKIPIPPDFKIEPIQETPKEKTVGVATPVPNDISQTFRISWYVNEPKVRKVIYIDARDRFTQGQMAELYAYAELQKQYLRLVVYNAVRGASLGRLGDVVPLKRVVEGDINKAVAKFGYLGTNNIQLSTSGVDPIRESTETTAERVHYFQYQQDEVGLVTVALLYAELDKIHQALAGIARNPQGYFYVVGETLLRLAQEYAKSLLVAYSA